MEQIVCVCCVVLKYLENLRGADEMNELKCLLELRSPEPTSNDR